MKKKQIILFLALLTAGLGLRAQDSIRHYASYFGENATAWIVGWCAYDFGYINHLHRVSGDTVIGNYTYKRIIPDSTDEINGLYEWEYMKNNLPILMREDTLTGRLWIRHAVLWSGHDNYYFEYLASDMSLEVGDTFYMVNYNQGRLNQTYCPVVNVDEYQGMRRITLRGYNDDIYLYEGIGHTDMFCSTQEGMDYYSNNYGGKYLLGCVYKDDTVVFSNPEIDTDYLENCKFKNRFGSVDESETPFSVTLYPNPCGEHLQIANLPDGVQGLYVTDMLGRRVYTSQQPAESIPTDQLPQGVYRLTVVMDNNQHYSLTFVKR